MIAIVNSLPVKEGAADEISARFAESRGHVQDFDGFVSMEVLKGEDEVLVLTRWRDRESFDAWVASEEFKKAHGRSGASDLLRGHPRMTTYEVALQRSPGDAGRRAGG